MHSPTVFPARSGMTPPQPFGPGWLVVAAWLVFGSLAVARDIHVGRDADAPSIAVAIKTAQPGDTIHLEPGRVYQDYAGFYSKQGAPGKPITLDGHGATLEGADPLDPGQWTEVGPGHFTCDRLLPSFNGAMLARWFFLFDGQPQRMGRVSKGRSQPLKDPADLRPGEWTFVSMGPLPTDHGQRIEGVFHLCVDPRTSLTESNIRVPVRSAGVQFSGDNAHLVIRNLTATHPHNDGFNIHGDCRDVTFENIRAIECGDDGISAHESAQYRVKGLTSVGNATGICDTGTAITVYEDVFMARNVGFDLYFLDSVQARIAGALIHSSAQHPLTTTGRPARHPCQLTLEQVHFQRLADPRVGRIASHSTLTARECTFDGLTLDITGESDLEDCLLNGQPTTPSATGANILRLRRLAPMP